MWNSTGTEAAHPEVYFYILRLALNKMKYIKRSLYAIITFIIVSVLSVFAILKIEDSQLSYLKISNQIDQSFKPSFITNVNIIPMTTYTVDMSLILQVTNGIIERIDTNPPVNQEGIIDAKGIYLSPGLIDMHVKVWDKFELGLHLPTASRLFEIYRQCLFT